MSVEDHSLKAIGHEHKYQAIVAKYGTHIVRTLMGQTVHSLAISAGLNVVCIPLGMWEFDWTRTALHQLLRQ